MADQPKQPRERLVSAEKPTGPFDLPTVRAGRVKIKLDAAPDTDEGTDFDVPQANEPGGAKVVA